MNSREIADRWGERQREHFKQKRVYKVQKKRLAQQDV